MNKVDFDKNGEINYSEFISGSLDRNLLSKTNLWKVFKYLDSEGKNILTFETFQKAFLRKGERREEEITQMLHEINVTEQSEGITFGKLCEIMEVNSTASDSNYGQQKSNSTSTRSNSLF